MLSRTFLLSSLEPHILAGRLTTNKALIHNKLNERLPPEITHKLQMLAPLGNGLRAQDSPVAPLEVHNHHRNSAQAH